MKNKNGYKEILDFISEHGIENKDLQQKDKKNCKKTVKRKSQNHEKVIDLHGKKEEEAEKIFRNALLKSKDSGFKKLLVIHGKGIHSDPLEGPVLKKLVEAMLSVEFKNIVREYYLAPYNKGGSGATIVILK